jgi:L-threonylcarbamoyladenylate synthase
LLRPGSITAHDIEATLAATLVAPNARSPRTPGSLPKHYAPQTPLMLMEADLMLELASSMVRQGERVAVLARSVVRPVFEGVTWIAAPAEAAAYAHDLYAHLRVLDRAGCSAILVEQPPLEPQWAAIHDRLMRAAAGSALPDAT